MSATRPKKKAVSKLKTRSSGASVVSFLNAIADLRRREDAFTVLELMKKITKTEPKMWGGSIVGFGACHFRYASGRSGDWFPIGFSPRKDALVLYLMGGLEPHAALLKSLGKHKTGMGCLYIRSLEDIDRSTLAALLKDSLARLKATRGEDASGA